jgi:hypothetical protein
MRCPNCNGRDIGKIGARQYYCWGCFIELTIDGDKVSLHQVEEDGSLSSLDDLFFPQNISVSVVDDQLVVYEEHNGVVCAQPKVGHKDVDATVPVVTE